MIAIVQCTVDGRTDGRTENIMQEAPILNPVQVTFFPAGFEFSAPSHNIAIIGSESRSESLSEFPSESPSESPSAIANLKSYDFKAHVGFEAGGHGAATLEVNLTPSPLCARPVHLLP